MSLASSIGLSVSTASASLVGSGNGSAGAGVDALTPGVALAGEACVEVRAFFLLVGVDGPLSRLLAAAPLLFLSLAGAGDVLALPPPLLFRCALLAAGLVDVRPAVDLRLGVGVDV